MFKLCDTHRRPLTNIAKTSVTYMENTIHYKSALVIKYITSTCYISISKIWSLIFTYAAEKCILTAYKSNEINKILKSIRSIFPSSTTANIRYSMLITASHISKSFFFHLLQRQWIKVYPSKTSGPMRGVNQKWTGGRPLNRTSISDDFEQIFCVLDSDDTPTSPSTVVRVAKYVGVSDVSCVIRAWRPDAGWGGRLSNERCRTGKRGCQNVSFC